jgi:hypothetical protein
MNYTHAPYHDLFETKWTALGLLIAMVILIGLYVICRCWDSTPQRRVQKQIKKKIDLDQIERDV